MQRSLPRISQGLSARSQPHTRNMKKLIYLASPYTSTHEAVIERRVKQTQFAAAELIEAGHLIFSPIVHSHPLSEHISFDSTNTPGAMSQWMYYDKAMIDKADEVWVLCLDGWDESLGVEVEIEHALKQDKPVHFVSYPELKITRGSETRHAAGSFYSPQSTGEPPAKKFAPETHTVYAGVCALCKTAAIPKEQWACWSCYHRYFTDVYPTKTCLAEGCPEHDVKAVPQSTGERIDRKICVICGESVPDGRYCDCKAHLDAARFSLSEQANSLPDDAAERNSYPMADGLLYYFPNALAEVSKISKAGNEQHNPGQPLHWSRGKSTDHANKIIRHLIDAGREDEGSIAHAANCAWRALALLQEKIEKVRGVPLPKNAWVDSND